MEVPGLGYLQEGYLLNKRGDLLLLGCDSTLVARDLLLTEGELLLLRAKELGKLCLHKLAVDNLAALRTCGDECYPHAK